MHADNGYDTTNFQALRSTLQDLNERALADGLVAVRDGVVIVPRRQRRPARGTAAAEATTQTAPTAAKKKMAKATRTKKTKDRSPAAAARLLAMLRRRSGDESGDVAGTTFTEDGVGRLLARLRRASSLRRGGAWWRFLKNADRFLARPVPLGVRTIQGIGFDRLQVFARQLEQIEADGWARFQDARVIRRRKFAPVPALQQDKSEPKLAKTRRKGPAR